jgi:fructan beta-fructosidase
MSARLAVIAIFALALSLLSAIAPTQSHAATLGSEPYRPAIHYSPQQNWMNDPNGLIYYHGGYHMFYQYNKYGKTGGNASWGHAMSSDLVHWTELPVAIPVDASEEVWSGSVVYDRSNTSGLGSATDGPLIAVYTSAPKDGTGVQRQSIAYSNDGGMTWTKYAGNPVLDIGSQNFRDPKVFWYAPTSSWRMVVALSDQHKVAIYSSPDLKSWTLQSQFGPLGDISAVWECPDLFAMPVDGDKTNIKWVLTVNVAGKAQYFTGDFNGSTFAADDTAYTPPSGTVIGDFEGSTYGNWTTTGTAFGAGPAHSTSPTNGAIGTGWIDSYGSADSDTGTLTSPTFTINQNYLNFLIAGGNHPYVQGGSTSAPPGTVLQDFEGNSLPGWTGTGSFTNITPRQETLSGQLGNGVLDTCQAGCDAAEGTITSPAFTINAKYLDLLVAGGNHPMSGPMPTAVNVLVNGQIVASVTGDNSASMNWQAMDLSAYEGQQAQVQVVDQSDGSNGWGHLMVDDLVLSDAKANPWANETEANLLVNGQVVRSATGNSSPNLDWASWNLSDLQGQQAQIQLVDQNAGSDWGHTIADDFTLADTPATSAAQRAHWVDWGSDFYAAVSYNDAPSGKRIEIGWMNNWSYANDIPESPWRGAMALPRELSLTQTSSGLALTQKVVSQVDTLDQPVSYQQTGTDTALAGTQALPASASGQLQRVDLSFAPGSSTQSGITVLGDGTSSTIIGYDTSDHSVYLDRRTSGDTSFNSSFPSVSSAPVTLDSNGRVDLTIYLDRTSVEVFAQNGTRALTDLVFPNAGADAMTLFANGGTAQLHSITVTPLAQAMFLTPFTSTPAPTISGTPDVGYTVTANPGAWAPTPSSFTYQWSADDVDITGATGPTFVPTSAELGKRLTVTVTGWLNGYEPIPIVSAETAPVDTDTDTVPPTLTGVASDRTVEATGPAGAIVSWTPPIVKDLVDPNPSVVCDHTSGGTYPPGSTNVTCYAVDLAGNKSAIQSFTVIVTDTTPPTITGAPTSTVTATATSSAGAVVSYPTIVATDLVDGNVPVTCDHPSGTTFSLGGTTVTCTATDAHHNSANIPFTVRVTYSWTGVLQPVNANGSSIFKLGSIVPVRFALAGPSAAITDATATLAYAEVSNVVTGTYVEAVSTSAATTGNLFHYDASSGQYIFNWSTKSLTTGTYLIRIDLGDGATHTVQISLR